MIVGLGTDIVNIERMEKLYAWHGNKMVKRLFTLREEKEIAEIPTGDMRGKASKIAKLFAAKEAAVKALGTGFRDGITFRDIETTHDTLGRPVLVLHGKAKERFHKIGGGAQVQSWLNSSDDYPFAVSTVIIEKM